MLIPVCCFTCGKVLANKKEAYDEKVRERKLSKNIPLDKITYLKENNADKTIEGQVLDELKIKRPCCRTIMLTSVSIE